MACSCNMEEAKEELQRIGEIFEVEVNATSVTMKIGERDVQFGYQKKRAATMELVVRILGKKSLALESEVQKLLQKTNSLLTLIFLVKEVIEDLESGLGSTDDEENVPDVPANEIKAATEIHDRKSIFSGFACKLTDRRQVHPVLNFLLAHYKRLSQSKHIVWAYTVTEPDSGKIRMETNHDGENMGNQRPLLQVLEQTGARNILVAVSRVYGGIQIGPSRFRHYVASARAAIELLPVENRTKMTSSNTQSKSKRNGGRKK